PVRTHAVTYAANPVCIRVGPANSAASGSQIGSIATAQERIRESKFAAQLYAVTNRANCDRFHQMLAAGDGGLVRRYRDVVIGRMIDPVARRVADTPEKRHDRE